MSMLRKLGAASAAILKTIMGPQVGKNDICDAIGYVTNAGAPTSVVPEFIGQHLLDTSNNVWYKAYGVSSGNWNMSGIPTGLSQTEINYLDGALSSNAIASKAAIIDSTGILALSNNKMATEAGAGITGGTGTVYKSSVTKEGGIITTRILIDLTGLGSSTTDLDVIGQGASAAHIGQITAARNGTILSGTITCFETPATGADDIDLYSATVGTAVFDDGIAALTETALLTRGAAWAAGDIKPLTGWPAANEYLYLTGGEGGTAGTYTAGKFLIELQGYDA
jgi:hypothetical protein